MSRVVVVGAGLGGLAVAARLARLRHEVVVIEQADAVGGALRPEDRAGFRFDQSPPLQLLPAALRDLFLKTGKPLESVVELEPADPVTQFRFADGTALDLPAGGVGDVATAAQAAFGGSAGRDWERFSAHAGRVWDAARGPCVEQPWEGPRSLRRLAWHEPGRLARIAPWRSLPAATRRLLRDPRQRALVASYAALAGVDPRRAPAALAVLPYVEQSFRAWWVTGGTGRLADAVHERAIARGAVVVTGSAVTDVTTSAGRVDGVRLADGRLLPAEIVVRADGSAASSGDRPVIVLALGLRGLTPGMARHTVVVPADPGGEPVLSVFRADAPGSAPADGESWSVFVSAPTAAATPDITHVLDRLATAGYDVRDQVVVSEQHVHRPAALHHRPAVTGSVPGLFHVAGSPRRPGGVALAALSAASVAELVGRA